jgi:3-hydroxyisobutyrate dehydrogenase-like beta-hydroxyacid dehydrogenase
MRHYAVKILNTKEFELMQSVAKPRIAFLGIGLMGKPMATRLLQAGYDLTAWNRTQAKADELLPLGAKVAQQATDAVRTADIVITMLEAGPVVAQVLAAALPGLQRGALVVDMSSTRQSEAQDAHAMLAEHGVRFIDAPVSGGVVGAQAGSLAIMAGGSSADFAELESVLATMGRPTLVGPAGCGQIAKLCNQLIVGGTLNIVAEALLLAQAGGADPAAVRAAIRGGFAESRILEVHGQRMLERNFMPGGQVKSQFKDLENVLIAAANAGLNLPVTELVTENYRSILQRSPQADQSAVLLALEQGNPGLRLGASADQLPD